MPHLVPVRHRTAATLCAALLLAGLGATARFAAPAEAAPQPGSAAQTGTKPSAPRAVAARLTAPGRVTVTWDAPSNEGSSAVTGYTVIFSTGQAGGGTPAAATDRSAVLGPLTKGSYTFSVLATNAAGDGPQASTSLAVPAANAPMTTVSASSIVSGDSLTVSGQGARSSTVRLQRALPGGSWTTLASLPTDGSGAFSDTRVERYTARYRVLSATGVASAISTVTAKGRVTAGAVRNAVRTYTLSGYVYPAHTGQPVALASQRADGTYAALATVRTSSTGHWTYKHTYPAVRSYTLRARSAATTRNAAGSTVLDVPVS
jgi:hypothetical protein